MIRFAETPDHVFLTILHEAMESMRDWILIYKDSYQPTPQQLLERELQYKDVFPMLHRIFSLEEVVRQIARLLEASRDETQLYMITDYHWLILHACLESFVEGHNEAIPRDRRRIGPYDIARIDLDAILDTFFWDLDFLQDEELVARLGEKGRAEMGISPETFGVAAGLTPHPDELQIVPVEWESADGKPVRPERPKRSRFKTYPD